MHGTVCKMSSDRGQAGRPHRCKPKKTAWRRQHNGRAISVMRLTSSCFFWLGAHINHRRGSPTCRKRRKSDVEQLRHRIDSLELANVGLAQSLSLRNTQLTWLHNKGTASLTGTCPFCGRQLCCEPITFRSSLCKVELGICCASHTFC